jgi:hypothetical protein
LALGAQRSTVMALVVRQSAAWVTIGILLGVRIAAAYFKASPVSSGNDSQPQYRNRTPRVELNRCPPQSG